MAEQKMVIEVHRSDLGKVLDVLDKAVDFHHHRDMMNAALHLSGVRYTPLTSELEANRQRVRDLLHPPEGE